MLLELSAGDQHNSSRSSCHLNLLERLVVVNLEMLPEIPETFGLEAADVALDQPLVTKFVLLASVNQQVRPGK